MAQVVDYDVEIKRFTNKMKIDFTMFGLHS